MSSTVVAWGVTFKDSGSCRAEETLTVMHCDDLNIEESMSIRHSGAFESQALSPWASSQMKESAFDRVAFGGLLSRSYHLIQ